MKKPTKKSVAPAAPGAESKSEVAIRAPSILRTTIKLRGISSLIMHAWSKKAIEMIEAKQQKKATGPKSAKVPLDEFNGARYIIDEDTDGIPAICLKNCAVEAGVTLGMQKTYLRKCFFVNPDGDELVPITCPEGPKMRTDMVRVGMGTADVRYRPEYKHWSLEVPVEFNSELISAHELLNLFENAGYSVGLGEWRPQKDGVHGRFKVEG